MCRVLTLFVAIMLQGWFSLPAHHYSNGFSSDDHGLEPITCTSTTRGMMFYDVTGAEDGVCICACKSSDSDYAW